MDKIIIYTDGAYSSSRNQGGYAFVVLKNGIKVYQEFYPLEGGTNNTAEIYAALEACKWAKYQKFNEITIYTDSMYVIGAISLGNKRKANVKLLSELDNAVKEMIITWTHVKGHEGDKYNEFCDALAVTASQTKLN
jgi:ribonuclease HI